MAWRTSSPVLYLFSSSTIVVPNTIYLQAMSETINFRYLPLISKTKVTKNQQQPHLYHPKQQQQLRSVVSSHHHHPHPWCCWQNCKSKFTNKIHPTLASWCHHTLSYRLLLPFTIPVLTGVRLLYGVWSQMSVIYLVEKTSTNNQTSFHVKCHLTADKLCVCTNVKPYVEGT